MDRMNPLDATFLYLENGITHMDIASCGVFEGPSPAYDDVLALFAAKLPLVPRYRQRVLFVPLDLGRPVWVDDAHFNLEYHVRHTALPPPGETADLERLMGRLMSQELDRRRPLWEVWIVEGLADGRWAVISKVHHCMVDGVAGVDLVSLVLDASPDAPLPNIADEWRPGPEPTGLQLASDALVNLVTSPREQLRAVWAGLRGPRRAWRQFTELGTGFRAFGSALRATPPTSVDGTIGPHRRWTVARSSLAEVKEIRHALGGTVNDVVLAAIAAGFRDLVVSRGEDPDGVVLRTLVPVSVRPDSERGTTDNRVSAIFLDLPIHIADPLERIDAVRAEMGRLKQSHEPEAGEALTSLAGLVPPLTASALRLASRLGATVSQRSMNTVTTNVPGPPLPLYAAGREMVEYLPFVPLGPGVRVGVAILSYTGKLAFGITGDFDAAPDIEVLADGIERAMATMLTLSRDGSDVRRDAGAEMNR